MSVSICQIYYLHVANEEIESSCVACPGLYLKSGSFAYFLTWDETIRPLNLSLGKCVETMRWSRRNRGFAVDVSRSEFLSRCLDFLPLCLSLMSLCVDWQRGYMCTQKVYWNKGQLLAAALWREGESGRWSWKPNGLYQGHNLLPLFMHMGFLIFENCLKKSFSITEWAELFFYLQVCPE